jgi:chorismate mutase/prephenate dehydratase
MPMGEWRRKIDDVDEKIVKLISKRASIVEQIGKAKLAGSGGVFVPAREKQIYARLRKLNQGPLTDAAVRGIFREIISCCRAIEGTISVAYLGPEGTFTHVAAYDIFGDQATYIPSRDIRSVFSDVQTGRAYCGVVPIENSSEGAVRETLDTFLASELQIVSEEVLPIHLTLLGRGKLADVKRVASKPIALAQCRSWLAEHLSDAELVETVSTAAAAELAARQKGAAIVAHETAARLYKLRVLRAHIEDYERNATRFLVIGFDKQGPTGSDKTSILCSVKHQAGSLVGLLGVFRRHKLNMTYLYPRPSRDQPWEYFFYIDVAGHQGEPNVAAALEDAEKHCSFFKVLGSFPRAD